MTIILDYRATPRRIDNNCINRTSGNFFMPSIDCGSHRGIGFFAFSYMMSQCPATIRLFAHNHLDTKPI